MPPSDNPFLARIVARLDDDPVRAFAEVWAGAQRATLTWGDLGRRARAFAAAYRCEGLVPGDIVFIILRHGPDLYPSYLGAMLAGCVPSFLPFPSLKQDPDLYWTSHIAVFARTGARLLVTYGELAADIRMRMEGAVRIIDVASIEDENVPHTDAISDETAVALLQHSSGTTGLKKGVALSYRAIRLQIEAYGTRLGLDEDDVIASWLPLYHDMGLIACFMLPLYLGIKLVSLDAFEWTVKPSLLLEAIETHRATHVWLPNFAFAHIARATRKTRRFELGSLRALIGCSEPNRPAVFDLFRQRFESGGIDQVRMQTCYAMAETVFAVSHTPPGSAPRRLAARVVGGHVEAGNDADGQVLFSNGPVLPGVEVQVLLDGRLHGEGVAGEICVRAPFLFDGYFSDAAATAAAFVDGFFRTGDLGFVHEGEIYIFGRTKELIIVNGRNFFANDIEDAATDVEGVKKGRCVAFGLYFPAFGAEQIVVVAEHDGVAANAAEMTSAIANALNARIGTSPGDIRIVEPGWLVKTTSGKLSRSENIRKYVRTFQPDLAAFSIPEAVT